MISGVPEVRTEADIAELREGSEVLERSANCVLLRRISREVINGERVRLPLLDQTDAAGTLIAHVEQVIACELILHARIEVHHVRIAHVRIPPFGASLLRRS